MMQGVLSVLLVAMATRLASAYTPNLARDMYNMVPINRVPYTRIQHGNVSKACTHATATIPEATKYFLADAAGKPAAGAFVLNLMWMGHYDECRAIYIPGQPTKFKYCTIQMMADATSVVPKLIVPVSWGVCAPMDCSVPDVINSIEELAEMYHVDKYFFPNPDNFTQARSVCSEFAQYDTGFICVVTFCSIVLFLMVSSSLYQAVKKIKNLRLGSVCVRLENDPESSRIQADDNDDDVPLIGSDGNLGNITVKEPPKMYNRSQVFKKSPCSGFRQGDPTWYIVPNFASRIIECFSLSTNLSKLLALSHSDRSISCLNGLRVISMFWVILGHTFAFGTMLGGAENLGSFANFAKRLGFQAILNGTFSVDTFFFLSGLLLGYLTLMRMSKTGGNIPWFWFYFHRFWRLTPVYMFTMLFYMYLAPHMGKGPFWPTSEIFTYACNKYWWTNLLYINNFWGKSMNDGCIAWTWYLANDMQFFIISPIFLIMLFKFPIVGLILVGAAMNASFITTGLIIWYYDLPAITTFNPTIAAAHPPPMDFMSLVYEKPYCRISPYLTGIFLGYAMFKIGKRKVQLNPIAAFTGWVVAAAIAMSVLYGTYPSIHDDKREASLAANIIYGTFSRYAWSISLAWVVFACNYGYGGWINSILSWSGWIVLSRLTYTAYLVHPIVIFGFYFNFGAAIHFSLYLFAIYFAGCMAVSYGLAACFSLVIEFPFANFEKLLMPKDVQSKRKLETLNGTRQNIQLQND